MIIFSHSWWETDGLDLLIKTPCNKWGVLFIPRGDEESSSPFSPLMFLLSYTTVIEDFQLSAMLDDRQSQTTIIYLLKCNILARRRAHSGHAASTILISLDVMVSYYSTSFEKKCWHKWYLIYYHKMKVPNSIHTHILRAIRVAWSH